MKNLSFFYSVSLFLLATAFTQLKAQTTKAYAGTGYFYGREGEGIDVFDVENMTIIGNITEAGGYRFLY